MVSHLDLMSGIGGFALAARWLGLDTIGFCEIDPWCQRVLAKNFPGVPIHDDLKTLTASTVRDWLGGEAITSLSNSGRNRCNRSQEQNIDAPRGLQTSRWDHADGRGMARARTLDLITAGYPCQPFSHAGKRLGQEDDRHLWPTIAALVAELRPRWCLFENVAGHISLGLDDVLSDLEALGYTCWPLVVPACAVNAPHRRDRIWLMAHRNQEHDNGCGRDSRRRAESANGRHVLADAPHGGLRRGKPSRKSGLAALSDEAIRAWWEVEPAVGRVAHGIPHRVDRLKGLGNAIVPQVAYVILAAMFPSLRLC